jgi:hypothetical protein
MFMVQLLVKLKFFIQELWERKSLQILLTTGVSCALGTAVYYTLKQSPVLKGHLFIVLS